MKDVRPEHRANDWIRAQAKKQTAGSFPVYHKRVSHRAVEKRLYALLNGYVIFADSPTQASRIQFYLVCSTETGQKSGERDFFGMDLISFCIFCATFPTQYIRLL